MIVIVEKQIWQNPRIIISAGGQHSIQGLQKSSSACPCLRKSPCFFKYRVAESARANAVRATTSLVGATKPNLLRQWIYQSHWIENGSVKQRENAEVAKTLSIQISNTERERPESARGDDLLNCHRVVDTYKWDPRQSNQSENDNIFCVSENRISDATTFSTVWLTYWITSAPDSGGADVWGWRREWSPRWTESVKWKLQHTLERTPHSTRTDGMRRRSWYTNRDTRDNVFKAHSDSMHINGIYTVIHVHQRAAVAQHLRCARSHGFFWVFFLQMATALCSLISNTNTEIL